MDSISGMHKNSGSTGGIQRSHDLFSNYGAFTNTGDDDPPPRGQNNIHGLSEAAINGLLHIADCLRLYLKGAAGKTDYFIGRLQNQSEDGRVKKEGNNRSFLLFTINFSLFTFL